MPEPSRIPLSQRPRAPQAAPQPQAKAPAEPRRHHWREIWDHAWHGVGAFLKALALWPLIVGGFGAAFGGVYYFLCAERFGAGMDVLILLDLEAPATDASLAAQQAIFRAATPPPMQVDVMWKAYVLSASLIYWVAVLVRPGRRG